MLADFYKALEFPDKDRIPLEKNVVIIVPKKDFDLKPVLKRLGVPKCEVAVTWPKDNMDLTAEIGVIADPKFVFQVGEKVSRKYAFLPDDGSLDAEFKAKIEALQIDDYVSLHHHDEFSIKDGLGTVDQLIKLLGAQRRSYCCVTNHGSVGGWIKQYNACKKKGVKAIFGMEAYVSDYRGDDMEQKKAHRSANHLILLAKTMEGFQNIIQIHNDAQLEGFYYSPRADHAALKKWGKGIIASTACLAGEIPSLLMADKKDEAKALYEFYKGCFDEFYIELQIIEYEAQREANRRLIQFAREVGAPLVLTCDSHYLEAEHSATHDILMCIRQHKTLFDAKGEENEDVWNFTVKNMFCRSKDQMRKVFEDGFVDKDGTPYPAFKDEVFTEEVFQEAMANTRKIAVSTEDIKLDSAIKLPKLYVNSADIMREKIEKGFVNRILDQKQNKQVYRDRLEYEFGVITKLGWTDYFLIMDKIISDTVAEYGEWAIGYGRGSAAGSLISYCLGMTDVDPLPYGLLFERFLDESRPTPPDIDTDFDPRIRDWVKQHIIEVFGAEHVCSIGTYQTYRTKAVILDVVRALNEDVVAANEVTKKIDSLDSFEDDEGDEKKVDKLSFKELEDHYPDLKKYFADHQLVRVHAEILRNQVKNMGKHAGGVIISDIVLQGKIPVMRDKEGNVVSAWSEAGGNEELSSVGLVKYDILGLKNLPVVSDCIQLVKLNRGIEIKRWEIPIDDAETISKSCKKDLHGIFQLDNPATKPVADAVKMESLEDVAAVTSLIRPGPRDMKMDIEYAERKHGKQYAMPVLIRNLLTETYGVVTYQEQAMKIAQVLAGFPPSKSYKFLKAIAKKQVDLMASFKADFMSGSQKHVDAGELTLAEVENIWDLLSAFAEYAFNKSVYKDELVWCNGSVKKVGDVVRGDRVMAFDGERMVETEVVDNHDHGILPAFEVVFEGRETVVCSILHKFETEDGKVPLWKLLFGNTRVYHAEDSFDIMSGLRDGSGFAANAGSSRSVPGSHQNCQRESSFSQSEKGFGQNRKASCRESQEASTQNGKRGCIDASCQESSFRKYEEIECVSCIQRESPTGLVKNCSTDIYAFRDNRTAFAGIEEVAASEPGRIHGDNEVGSKGEKRLPSGNLVVGTCTICDSRIPQASSDSLCQHGQGSGLREQGCMDRSGRMLAFRDRLYQETVSCNQGSRKRHLAEQRSRSQEDCVDSLGIELLEREWSCQVESGMDRRVACDTESSSARRVSLRRVLSARFVGFRPMCDLEVSHLSHNFALANGIITSNSHAITYSALSTVEMWLKQEHPKEYVCSLINNSELGKKKHGQDEFVGHINYARHSGIEVLPPDVSMSHMNFAMYGEKILFSIGHVKNVASMAEVIEKNQPYVSIQDFYDRVKVDTVTKAGKTMARRPNKKVVESLIEAGAFDKFGPGGTVKDNRNAIMVEYYRVRADKKEKPPQHDTDEEWLGLEKEVTGLCLSQPPLFRVYEATIRQKGWKLICELDERKRVMVFGKVESIVPKTSKTGNPMFLVEITDGLDNLTFYVFKGDIQFFRDHFKIGTIAAIPLSKFDEGDARFYDEKREPEFIKKGGVDFSTVPSPKTLIKKFADGTVISHMKGTGMKDGTKDDFYVDVVRPNGGYVCTTDKEYLTLLKHFQDKHGKGIYEDFKAVFDHTTSKADSVVLDKITQDSQKYTEDALEVDVLFTTLCAAMIAEENKKRQRLGKRIKMLAVHQVLVEGISPDEASKCSIGQDSDFLMKKCRERGF